MAQHEHTHNDEEEDFNINTIREVGAASYKALLNAKSLVKPGAKLIDVAVKAEEFAKGLGFGLAFPINLSINSEAAHYTPSVGDEKTFSDKDVVKIDFGLAKDGFLGDCAVTVDLSGQYADLVDVTADALNNAIATVRAGVRVSEIGDAIQKTIEGKGFMPVKNLGGHGVAKHDLHCEPFIPNYNNGDDTKLEEDMVIAIEPFATLDKKGMVFEGDVCEIYEFAGESVVRSPYARMVQSEVMEKYATEPFAVRWLTESVMDRFGLYVGVKELLRAGSFVSHPVLVSLGGGIVAQAEAQVLVTKDGCEVLTK